MKAEVESPQVTFTTEVREELRAAYGAAVEKNEDSFIYNGNEYVVGYAKYLLQYLDMVLVQ